jgi:hypothetical protein
MRWGARVTPLRETQIELPPSPRNALQLVQALMRAREETSGSKNSVPKTSE